MTDSLPIRQSSSAEPSLDDDLLANLDRRAARNNLDRNGYLRWVLTGKEPSSVEARNA
jgi:hypothetical protein